MANLPRVLVVDDSRLVRASLVQHIRAHYEVREEGDGEAAWQALVLDQSIRAVVSDLQMPKMNGYQLLERLRTSRLRRLQQMPFILVSGEETEEERAKARAAGASDFITKGSGTVEILTRLGNLLALQEAHENIESVQEERVQNPQTGLYTRKFLELQIAQALSHSARHGIDVSLMVLGFDGFEQLSEKLGLEQAEKIIHRFARMLAAKVRQEDSLGHVAPGCLAVVSPGTALVHCASFAERVRQAVEASRLAAHGETIELTVSIGLAGVPADTVTSAGALLDLAMERMEKALQAGGNRIESNADTPAQRPITIAHALELLRVSRSDAVLPHLETLLGQLLPLLGLMDQTLTLGLPMDVIRARAADKSAKK
ncbi:diguanylate cyclase [Azonexus sp.]|uniref:GGDEF domain-containing response regulator n=1 Tax=Azonexus sp. TaxID=1872668 RepID=UPI0039E4EE16